MFGLILKRQNSLSCECMACLERSAKCQQMFKTKSYRKSSNFRFQWTKICTRIILSITQSSLHFVNAKYINNCLKLNTENKVPMGTRESKFEISENVCKHRQNLIIGFISPVLLSVSHKVQHSFSTFGVARNDHF